MVEQSLDNADEAAEIIKFIEQNEQLSNIYKQLGPLDQLGFVLHLIDK